NRHVVSPSRHWRGTNHRLGRSRSRSRSRIRLRRQFGCQDQAAGCKNKGAEPHGFPSVGAGRNGGTTETVARITAKSGSIDSSPKVHRTSTSDMPRTFANPGTLFATGKLAPFCPACESFLSEKTRNKSQELRRWCEFPLWLGSAGASLIWTYCGKRRAESC